MLVLAIETSTREGSVALTRDSAVVAVERLAADHAGGGAGRMLAPAVRRALVNAGVAIGAVDLFAVGIGPGGYTGTRLAVATARALAFAAEKPVIGVVSLAALAASPAVPDGEIVCALDAKNDDLYAAWYRKHGSELIEVRTPRVRPAAALAAELPDGVFVAGDGLPRLAAHRDASRPVRGDATLFARAEQVAALGGARFARGERDSELMLLPLYLRPSEAERLWAARKAAHSKH